jgi:hypothetical protein
MAKRKKKVETIEVITETESSTLVEIKLIDSGYLLPQGYAKKGDVIKVIPSEAVKFVSTGKWQY